MSLAKAWYWSGVGKGLGLRRGLGSGLTGIAVEEVLEVEHGGLRLVPLVHEVGHHERGGVVPGVAPQDVLAELVGLLQVPRHQVQVR